MSNDFNREPSKSKTGVRSPASSAKASPRKEEEVLREQSRTETEERPYLDTEGGE